MRTPIAGPLGFGLLGLAFLSAGCAYFNTFYLAKKYYREGQKAQERSLTEGVAPEAGQRYDLTIRQCQKVLTDYPKSKWADDAAFLMAASLYGKGDYVAAIRRVEEFRTNYSKSPFIPEARLIQGLSHLKRRSYADADSIFLACDRDYPKFERGWDLYFNAGESRAAQRDYPGALDWYGRAVSIASNRRQKSDALRRTGDALLAHDRADSAIVIYERALREEERSKYRLDIALRRAEALRDLGRYTEALVYLEQWRPNALANQREGELLLRLHDVQARIGRVQEAIEGYRRLVELNPNTPLAADAQFRIGYLYESSLGDYEGAAREYEKLRQGPPSEFQSQANRRSQGLATLKKFRETVEGDSTQSRARAAFMLAELYYFQLDRPDSAVLQYRQVEREFPQSIYAPKSAYARLWITSVGRGDTLAARALTDSIAAEYRGTRFAESALYLWKRWSGRTDERTALLDSLLANPDTTGAERFLPEEEEAPGVDTTPVAAGADSGYTMPPAMQNLLAARRAALLGQPPPPSPAAQDSVARAAAVADSLKSAARIQSLRLQAEETRRRAAADSTRAAGSDSTAAAGSDSTRAAPDSTATRSPGTQSPPPDAEPSDSTAIFITPTR
jgi:tetratricopeptide (TPR) repeat protein